MTHGSLFSGVGGFDLGFKWAGIKTLWEVEIDPYCRQVLERQFPDARRFNDIRECGAHNLPAVDILSGGFPCQDISVAGKGGGLSGSRSSLWFEYKRIIKELKPRYAVIENVSRLLSINRGRDFLRILSDLAEIGYDAEWDSLRASDFGAWHRRERVWIVAYPSGNGCRGWDYGNAGRGSRTLQTAGSCAVEESEVLADALRHGSATGLSRSHTREKGNAGITDNGGNERILRRLGAGDRASSPQFSNAVSIEQGRYCEWWPSGVGWWEREPAEALQIARQRRGEETWMSELESYLGRVADGIPHRVDRLRGLGNAIVPQIAEYIGRCIMTHAGAL